MSATFEDNLFDFDIDLLQPSVSHISAIQLNKDLQRKQLRELKKRCIKIEIPETNLKVITNRLSFTEKLNLNGRSKYLFMKIMTDETVVLQASGMGGANIFSYMKKKWGEAEIKKDQYTDELRTTRSECQQVCLKYQDSLEKNTQLEKDLQELSKQNEELDKKLILSQNQYEGLQSHVNQLQLLLKERESLIDKFNVEKQVEKYIPENDVSNVSAIQKENRILRKHLHVVRNVALGKKKLSHRHRVILQKYNIKDVSMEEDSLSDNSCGQSDFFDDPPTSPLFLSPKAPKAGAKNEQIISKSNKLEINLKKDTTQFNEDNESDFSYEVVSVDTGRGSSLAFSEKCFNSPDYFSNDSPENITRQIGKNNENISVMDSGTSPIRSHNVVDVSTSPLMFDDIVLLRDKNTLNQNKRDSNSTEYFINEIVTIKEKRKMVNSGTSPIKEIEKVNKATSPLCFERHVDENETVDFCTSELTDYQTIQVRSHCPNEISISKPPSVLIDDTLLGVNGKHTIIDNLTTHCELEISGKSNKEKKCLERNNSKIICDENSIDGEVDMILNAMRLTQRLITPIPKTPVKVHKNESRKVQELVQNVSKLPEEHIVCRESLALREENKILHKDVDDLKKEMVYIKSLLQNHLLNNDKTNVSDSNKSDTGVNTEINDDTIQETVIVICPDDDDSNDVNEFTNLNGSSSMDTEMSTIIESNNKSCTGNTIPNLFMSSENSKQESTLNASKSPNLSQVNKSSKIDNSNKIQTSPSVDRVTCATNNNNRDAIIFEDDYRSEDESDIIINNCVKDSSIDCTDHKKKKIKKLTKLDKFKQKLLPKSKISVETSTKKIRSKSKRTAVVQIIPMNPTAILSNKSVYENAAKVMAELKLKAKNTENKECIAREEPKSVRQDHINEQELKCTKVINPERHKRRKSHNRQDLNDKDFELDEDVDLQIDLRPITTRSRSRKLSSGSNASRTPMKNEKMKNGSTDSSIIKNKRVLRSSSNRDLFIDLDCVKKAAINDNAMIFSDIRNDKQRKRKLSNNSNENLKTDTIKSVSTESNTVINANSKIISDTPNKKRKCIRSDSIDLEENDNVKKLFYGCNSNTTIISNTPDNRVNNISSRSDYEEQNTISGNFKEDTPIKTKDHKLSKTEHVKQNISDKVMNDSNISNKIQKFFKSEREKLSMSDCGRQLPGVTRKVQKHTKNTEATNVDQLIKQPKHSILCKMLETYGRLERKSQNKKVPDTIINSMCKNLEEGIAAINELPASKAKLALMLLFDDVQSWNVKHFYLGLITYLKDPERKRELYNKVNAPPAPLMTKSEQVVLYIVREMEADNPNTVNVILNYIEYSLFQLNRTPDFDIIETLSHYYALLCRYFGLKGRLRLFLLDAMYCLQFKVVPLIKQCLDVWMHILPLAHMGIAKSPLVTCLVYLLHFYKCEDRFNRVAEIRIILSQKYFYNITDWNEPKILEMFKNAVNEVRDIPIEKKMLRMALILLGKRHGAKWCHKNIIKNMLMPMIENETTPKKIKIFCIKMLGPLLKPFPADMKVHVEITFNNLLDMLQQNPPDAVKEAIFTSLIYINHHNPNRVSQAFLKWMPHEVSLEFEGLMRDYIRGKPLNMWKMFLSKMSM